MCSVPLTEFYLEAVIREGLEDLRNNPTKIDMLFSRFLLNPFKQNYGQKTIDLIKDYVLNGKIGVVQAWSLVPASLPCYSINIIGTSEQPNRAFFQDYAGDTVTVSIPTTIKSFVADSYDSLLGEVHVSDAVDLSDLSVGLTFRDAAAEDFTITGPIINTLGQKRFGIGEGLTVTVGNCYILGLDSYKTTTTRATPLVEEVQIGVHAAENTNLCKFLYYMLLFFLQDRRYLMEAVDLQIDTFTVTEFVKIAEYLPENVLNRFVNMKILVWFTWEGVLRDPEVTQSGVRVKVDRDQWIKGGDDTVINTTSADDDLT